MTNPNVKIKYCVQVTNGGTFLQMIEMMEASSFNTLSGLKVIISETNLNPQIVSKSKELGIPLEFIDVSTVPIVHRRKFVADETLEILKKYHIDYLFLISNRILEGQLLKEYHNRIINFHPSILPSFKGVDPIERALKSKAFMLGITAHFIDEKVDEGIPLMMYMIHNRFCQEEYESTLDEIYFLMFVQIVAWLSQNRVSIENDYSVVAEADYTTTQFIPNLEIKNDNI